MGLFNRTETEFNASQLLDVISNKSQLTVSKEDLEYFANSIIKKHKSVMEEEQAKRNLIPSTLTKDEVMIITNRTANTLWKWGKDGVLIPFKDKLGKLKYKTDDVAKFLGGMQEIQDYFLKKAI